MGQWTNFPNGISVTTATGSVAGTFNGGTYLGQSVLITGVLVGASTALEAAYIPVPFAGYVKYGALDIRSGTVGTGAAITTFVNDTAGTAIFASGSFASAGTSGGETLVLGSAGTVALTAGQSICVVKASCATAYGAGFCFEFIRT